MARRKAQPKRGASFAKYLVIMAKSPRLGRVKLRLGREIGEVAALRVYRASLRHVVIRLARDTRWRTLLAVTPGRDLAEPFLRAGGLASRLPQGEGDLGRRMQRIFAKLPPGPVLIVGSDIPAVTPRLIAQAFGRLGGADAVLGPAQDGGFWLIGLRRSPKILAPFARVRWSSRHALADTIANLDGYRMALTASLRDVDTAQDFERERSAVERLVLPRSSA
jgi:rSAM/selenodomain-associated transferase 1